VLLQLTPDDWRLTSKPAFWLPYLSDTRLMSCTQCGGSIDEEATACPRCGAPVAKLDERSMRLIAVVVIVLLFALNVLGVMITRWLHYRR
jgi:uncharacterized paraquat-inducible protein A